MMPLKNQLLIRNVRTLLNTVDKKRSTLNSLDEQILHSTGMEGIEDEIIETDEYYIELENKLHKYKKCSSLSSQNHHLSKLSLPHFNRDILDWQYFLDSYELTVQLNHTLTDVQKFSYLKSLLQFDAASVISGLTMTNANYHKAVDLLVNR